MGRLILLAATVLLMAVELRCVLSIRVERAPQVDVLAAGR